MDYFQNEYQDKPKEILIYWQKKIVTHQCQQTQPRNKIEPTWQNKEKP